MAHMDGSYEGLENLSALGSTGQPGSERLANDVLALLAELKFQVLHDPLTGLPNRVLLENRMKHAVAIGQRGGSVFSVLMIDLDGFKAVNDSFGHAAGDELLREIGPRLRQVLRESDTVARLGGDEFVVLLQGVDEAAAIVVARKILHALRPGFALSADSAGIRASIGIAVYPRHGNDPAVLLRHADEAMYAAKRQEGGFAVFTPAASLPRPEPRHRRHVRQS